MVFDLARATWMGAKIEELTEEEAEGEEDPPGRDLRWTHENRR